MIAYAASVWTYEELALQLDSGHLVTVRAQSAEQVMWYFALNSAMMNGVVQGMHAEDPAKRLIEWFMVWLCTHEGPQFPWATSTEPLPAWVREVTRADVLRVIGAYALMNGRTMTELESQEGAEALLQTEAWQQFAARIVEML